MNIPSIICGKCLSTKRLCISILLAAFTLLSFPSFAQTCYPPPSGLVSWWAGETNAVDMGGINNGTLVGGVAFSAGKVGQAFDLNGSHQYVDVGNNASLTPAASFTIEGWIYPRQDQANIIMAKWGNIGDYVSYRSYVFLMHVNLGLRFAVTDQANIDNAALHAFDTPDNVLATNAWNHVAAVYDQSTGTRRIYVNGVKVAERADPPMTVFNNPARVTIGARLDSSTTSSEWFNGKIDELSFYSRALTASDIQGIYAADAAGKCPGVAPFIVGQPQSQSVIAGSNATFSVSATGTAPLSYQWQLGMANLAGATNASLTLTNVQIAQAGTYSVVVYNAAGTATSSNAVLTVSPAPSCNPAPSGLVSWWEAEGNASDSLGGNPGTLLNGTSFAAGEVGQAFTFNGTGAHVRVHDAPNLRFKTALTLEAWIYPTSVGAVGRSIIDKWDAASGFDQRSYGVGIATDGRAQMAISPNGTSSGYASVFSAGTMPANQWTHLVGTYDGTNMAMYVNGILSGSVAYSGGIFQGTNDFALGGQVGGKLSGGVVTPFAGLIDEASVYNRALSVSEVQAIYAAGNAGKCQGVFPPSIVSQPANQTSVVGGSASFTVGAGGTQPLTYQWKFGTNSISGATNASLTLTNLQLSQAGNYSVVVANSAGSAASANATLSINPQLSVLQVVSVNANAGVATVPIALISQGNENALGFSINFDHSVLSFVGATLGSGDAGASLLVNTNLVASGQLGVALSLPANTRFSAGTQQVTLVSFAVVPVSVATVSSITFGDHPILRQVSDSQALALAANYTNGTVTIPFGIEGDVSPRPGGDGNVTIIDWVQVGRFVAGLDTIANPGEFQKADCAPRSSLGDGLLTVADWVQAGRYAAGLDPLTSSGGPTGPPGGLPSPAKVSLAGYGKLGLGSTNRTLTVVGIDAQPGSPCQVSLELNSQGDENAVGFSLTFDPTMLNFTSASLGDGAAGATLNVNTNQSGSGTIAMALALPIGSTFTTSTQQVVKLNFMVQPSAKGSSPISFASSPVVQDIADSNAESLHADYFDGLVAITTTQQIVNPMLSLTTKAANLTISWPNSASGFSLESTGDLTSTKWTPIVTTPVTNVSDITVTVPFSGSQQFYRLRLP
ncbi:MAG: Conserved repeat domain protein [Pedosphaera sp.]|nr:Conserved repeat domain protein [Pedosphaera sp.]